MTTRDILTSSKPAAKAATQAVQRTAEQDVADPQSESAGSVLVSGLGSRPNPQQARAMRRMQRAVGNAQVQRMLSSGSQSQIQRTPAAAAKRPGPQQDPRFLSITAKAKQVAAKEKQHAPARSKAAEAQAAAVGPVNDISSQAAAAQVGKMNAQKPGTFDKQAFIAALNEAIARITPKNQEEADEFKQSGKAGELKDQVTGIVKNNKESAENAIETTTKSAPDPGNAKAKTVTPMKPEQAGAAPGSIGAGNAMPASTSAQDTSLVEGKQSLDSQLAAADVTEEQIKKSNEPSFTSALAAKKATESHAVTAPQQFRKQEQAILGQARSEAGAIADQATGGMHTGRVGALARVLGNKTTAKSQDERKRAEVATKIEGIYAKTKAEVTGILDGLDGKVNGVFEGGERAARAAFEQHVDKRMKAYKEQRYGGLLGPAKWLKDKVLGMPAEVNGFFQEGRQLYLRQMQGVISSVANVVGAELTRAKARIAQGKQEIQQYVRGLPSDLREVGQQAAEEIESKFDQLEQDIDAKQDALVHSLAQKYVTARDAVDARITEMQKANQGLVAKAKEALGGVIQTIIQLKNMLMGVLGRAAGVIGTIIKDPIRFLGNLIGAVKQGLNQFVGNIGKHLQQGLMGWLFGTLGDAGMRMPESLDLKGILSLVMQVMGLTYANIRARAVKLVGERTVKLMEGTVNAFQVLAAEGPAGLWHLIQDKVGDLKEQVLGQIKEFIITKIITAGITWLLSLFNPAAAFIKACKMIYDVIMFFIERGSQIMELVGAILDSISAIASGSIGAAAKRVEQALAKALPVAISFLASLIGIGGIGQRVKKIISSVQKPVFSAIDSVIKAAAKGVSKLVGKGKGKDKDPPSPKQKEGPDTRTLAQKRADLDKGLAEASQIMDAKDATPERVQAKLPGIREKYQLKSLTLVKENDGEYHAEGQVNPKDQTASKRLKGVNYEVEVGVKDSREAVLKTQTLQGTMEDILLKTRSIQLGQPEVKIEDLLGKRNYAMAAIVVVGKRRSGLVMQRTIHLSNSQMLSIYSSGSGKVVKEQIRLPIVEAGAHGKGEKRIIRAGDAPADIAQIAPTFFVSPGAEIITGNTKELQTFIPKLAEALDNRGFVPTLDKHSEQVVFQMIRMNAEEIGRMIEETDVVEITDMQVHIHSEREMCPVCAAASNYMVQNLEREAEPIYAALRRKRAQFRGVTVSSSGSFAGKAPSSGDSPTYTTASQPSGRTRPQHEVTPERATSFLSTDMTSVDEAGERE